MRAGRARRRLRALGGPPGDATPAWTGGRPNRPVAANAEAGRGAASGSGREVAGVAGTARNPGTGGRGPGAATAGRGRISGRGPGIAAAGGHGRRIGGRRRAVAVTVLAGGLGTLLGGPVAGAAAAAYTSIGVVAMSSRRRERAESAALDAMLDVLARLAAELRAGADPRSAVGPAVAPFAGAGDAGRLARRATAAVRVADSTGAPLADLLDRLDDDARSLLRRRRTATAQASGALATALLLAALPLAGIALGYAIGVDPGHVLLHTPLGAACAAGALAAQVAGLAWSQRITRAIGQAA